MSITVQFYYHIFTALN